MHRPLAVTAAAALAVSLTIAGCASQGGDPAGGDPADRLILGTTQSITRLDPAGSYDLGSWTVAQGLYQSLLTFRPNTTAPTPDAASACGWKGGGHRTYTCTLKHGLTFSNGDPLTARDVAFSMDRIRRINAATGPLPLLSGIEKTRAASADTVVFTLKAADATFPSKLATGAGSIVDHRIFPADRLLDDAKVIGSGRYTLAKVRGSNADLVPNPQYRGADKPKNKGVDIRHYGSSAAATAALRAGRIDMTDRLTPAEAQSMKNSPHGLQLHQGPGTQTRVIAFNTKDATTRKKAVRRAVAQLVDRNALAATTYRGTVDPLYSIVPVGIAGHTTAFSDAYPKPDPAKAKKLLRNAGVHTPVKLDFAWSNNPSGAAEAAAVKQQLERGGLFDVTVRELPWQQFLKAESAGTLQAYDIGWAPDFPDADNFAAPLLVDGGAFHTGWNSPEITGKLLPETAAEPDRVKAAGRFADIDRIVAEQVPMVPLWQNRQYIAASSKVTGVDWTLDTTNILRYWLIGKTQ